jgi:hypothetical protein
MKRKLSVLDSIEVTNPCPVPWDGMVGSETARFCTQCNRHVHDLSAMIRAEAEAFCRLNPTACVRLFRNEWSEVITTDSPKPGWVRKLAWVVPAWLGLTANVGCMQVTQGAYCPPKLTARDSSDAVRLALQTATDFEGQLSQPVEDVLERFGIDCRESPEGIYHFIFRDSADTIRGLHFKTSARDTVFLYFPAEDEHHSSKEWNQLRKEKVLGIAIRSDSGKTWKIAGLVDQAIHQN